MPVQTLESSFLLCFAVQQIFLCQPIHPHKDDSQRSASIHQLHVDQWRVGACEQSVKGHAQGTEQAGHVDAAEGFHSDLAAQVERHGHQQGNVKAQDAHPNPERAVWRQEGDQNL